MDDSSKTVFQLGADSLGAILHPRQHVRTVSSERTNRTTFLKEMSSVLEHISLFTNDKDTDEISKLLNEIEYSDPTSNEGTEELEQSLRSLLREMSSRAESGQPLEALPEKAMTLLAARNEICLRNK